MAEPVRIKPEPGVSSPFVEDELDESTDLEFYDPSAQGDAFNKMYLARLPAYLWQAWSKLDDDAEIQIGRVRQWSAPDGTMKVQMLLRSDIEQQKDLPKEYNMEIVNPDVNNTFIFTEQDLPSYAAKNKERAAALARGIPAHILRAQQQKQTESQPAERGKRPAPYTRRAIPKKTTIAGTVKHEVVCTPMMNAETEHFLTKRALEAQTQVAKVELVARLPPNGATDQKQWDNFLKMPDNKPTKAKKMENKTARWPENRVIDEIVNCFSEHRYWSIRAFRSKIPQPEAFIRDCVEKVAVLHRSGSFANHWSLKPEYESMIKSKNLPEPANDAAAPQVDIASDDEDDDIKMEDVI
ncbi:putative transcription initiation factor [Lasiosphaeris hirsuta]|uniref:Transcription initiation factor IIF subunit beta n=1 Tax=Lasiosphaeris hirsuta TaxID=260670 RepID=A0AA40BAR5_9PEZI|nr:putative transcription initiation factor [Lasiosphaeris hirsuta]